MSIVISYSVYYYIRVYGNISQLPTIPDFFAPLVVTTIYWVLIFMFFGLHRNWHIKSRLDEFAQVFKAISIGCVLLFFIVFVDDARVETKQTTRVLIVLYWSILIVVVGGARIIFRSMKRNLFERRIGLQNAVIVGHNEKAKQLYDSVAQYPAIGYKVIGFVSLKDKVSKIDSNNQKILGNVEHLSDIIKKYNVTDVLIAFESSDHDSLLEVISHCDNSDVSIKIIPDMYDIISGQARTNEIHGFPLIEIMPHIMQPWEESVKRLMDIVISIIILMVSAPLWILVGVAIKLDSPGPFLYSQERVGKDGKIFRMHKYRSMRSDAEAKTGPVWAPKDDPRVTNVGRFLRKTRLDEIPQFINVLKGEMSLVGPRPERPHFVEWLAKEIPLYKRRLAVRPGITGWAQIKQGYDQTIDDVRSKVRYDLFYIENMSFRMDMKILLLTFYTMIAGKGN